MRQLLAIGIFLVSVVGGILVGGLAPDGFLPEFWRLPIGVLLVGAGIVLAVAVFRDL